MFGNFLALEGIVADRDSPSFLAASLMEDVTAFNGVTAKKNSKVWPPPLLSPLPLPSDPKSGMGKLHSPGWLGQFCRQQPWCKMFKAGSQQNGCRRKACNHNAQDMPKIQYPRLIEGFKDSPVFWPNVWCPVPCSLALSTVYHGAHVTKTAG